MSVLTRTLGLTVYGCIGLTTIDVVATYKMDTTLYREEHGKDEEASILVLYHGMQSSSRFFSSSFPLKRLSI